MDNIKIIKVLGKGFYGTTYMVLFNGKKYALKRQKILRSYITKSSRYPMWREFDLFNWISKLNKSDQQFFMFLYLYKFYSDCDFSNQNQNATNKLILKLNKSKHCLDMLFDLKNGPIYDIYDKLLSKPNSKKNISLSIQFIYAISLLNNSAYVHSDLHMGNLTYTKTSNKYIQIHLNNTKYKFKSYGYQYSIIDYGLIKHKKYNLTHSERKSYNNHIKYNRDIGMFIIYVLLDVNFAIYKKNNHYKNQLICMLYNSYSELYTRIKNLILFNYPDLLNKYNILELDIANNAISDTKYKIDKILFFEMIQYIGIYQKDLIFKIYKIEPYPSLIFAKHIEFIKLNIPNYSTIIDYLIKFA